MDRSSIILVDAGALFTDPASGLRQTLSRAFPSVDSVEADRKVWVYRYAR
jgi:hypothetical protein